MRMKKMCCFLVRFKRLVAISGLGVIMLLLAGYTSRNFEITRNLDIFSSLFRELIVHYVDDVNVSEVMRTGIDEMLYSLDPYTNFISESEIEDVRFMTTGQYGGVGALIRERGDHVVVAELHEGFPAHKSGLLPGDVLLEINGQQVTHRTVEEVRAFLMGQPGTTLNILVEREGEAEPLLKSLEREVVSVDNIPYYGMLDDQLAYVKLNGFTQGASREVRRALDELMTDNQVEGVVLDLRGNGGGLLHEAVNIVNLFVEKGQLVVETKGRLTEQITRHHTLNEPVYLDIPLAVLIDQASASASEIVAGAIQDFDRGIIVGNRSFGKGLVQNVLPLSYNTQLKVTVAKYYIPSGRSIQAINYAERRPDGSVARIPDSLKVAHQTLGGRAVYDGGGITPDVVVSPYYPAHITRALMLQHMVFDFATRYFRNHQDAPDPTSFEITDAIYADFVRFIEDRHFSYETRSERMLTELGQVARQEQYIHAIQAELDQLRHNMLKEKEGDIETFRSEIAQLLREEIVSRYHFARGRVLASLNADPDIEQTLVALIDTSSYSRLLQSVQ